MLHIEPKNYVFLTPILYYIIISLSKLLYNKYQFRIKLIDSITIYHNIFMAIYSLLSFIYIVRETMTQNKLNTLEKSMCQDFEINSNLKFFIHFWYISKYLEWIDTLILIFRGKKTSTLQLIHHAFTPLLIYSNTYLNGLESYYHHGVITNSFVHTLMYCYFAFPNGFLRPYRLWITKIQIIQHAVCIFTLSYAFYYNCFHSLTGVIITSMLYLFFMIKFTSFYLNARTIKNK